MIRESTIAACLLLIGASMTVFVTTQGDPSVCVASLGDEPDELKLTVRYLEIVTPSMDATCKTLAEMHGVAFGDPIPALGNARVAELAGGGRIGVRAPMRASEDPVVRPYLLVDDIRAAVEVAEKSGAEVAIPPMEIPGEGTFAIYILGGIEHGLWER